METPVIDFHAHAGRWGSYGIDDDVTTYLRVMDAAGVDRTCVNCVFHGDVTRCNDRVAGLVERHPDRFIGVGYVTPLYPGEAIPELERCFDVLGMKFLKVYPTYLGRPIDDPSYFPIFEWMNDRGLVILSHSSYSSKADTDTRPRRFIGLAERYPRITWVLGHSGNPMSGQVEAVEAARSGPNIYLETCTSLGEHGTIEYLVEGAGPDRVLYGSDMPLMDARYQVGRIATAQIPDESKRKILGLNAIRLLGLESQAASSEVSG